MKGGPVIPDSSSLVRNYEPTTRVEIERPATQELQEFDLRQFSLFRDHKDECAAIPCEGRRKYWPEEDEEW